MTTCIVCSHSLVLVETTFGGRPEVCNSKRKKKVKRHRKNQDLAANAPRRATKLKAENERIAQVANIVRKSPPCL